MKTMHYDTLQRVRDALDKSGYGHEGILTAKFQGWNESGSEVHIITFVDDDEDGGTAFGAVYIDKDGKGEF